MDVRPRFTFSPPDDDDRDSAGQASDRPANPPGQVLNLPASATGIKLEIYKRPGGGMLVNWEFRGELVTGDDAGDCDELDAGGLIEAAPDSQAIDLCGHLLSAFTAGKRGDA